MMTKFEKIRNITFLFLLAISPSTGAFAENVAESDLLMIPVKVTSKLTSKLSRSEKAAKKAKKKQDASAKEKEIASDEVAQEIEPAEQPSDDTPVALPAIVTAVDILSADGQVVIPAESKVDVEIVKTPSKSMGKKGLLRFYFKGIELEDGTYFPLNSSLSVTNHHRKGLVGLAIDEDIDIKNLTHQGGYKFFKYGMGFSGAATVVGAAGSAIFLGFWKWGVNGALKTTMEQGSKYLRGGVMGGALAFGALAVVGGVTGTGLLLSAVSHGSQAIVHPGTYFMVGVRNPTGEPLSLPQPQEDSSEQDTQSSVSFTD